MREVCLSGLTFFGLSYNYFKAPEDYNSVVYEKIYLMKTYMGWSFEEIYMLPIPLRDWFINKWIEDNKKKEE